MPLLNSFEIFLGKTKIGFGGKINDIYFSEIDLDSILKQNEKYQVKLWPKYPPQIEDVTLILPEKTLIGNVASAIKESDKSIVNVDLTVVYKNAYTFRIWYQDPNKTLTNEDVEKIRKEIISSVKTKFGGIIKT